MPDLHRAGQAYLAWVVTSNVPLGDTPPTVAIYPNGTNDPLVWHPMTWRDEPVAMTVGVRAAAVTTYSRTAVALVAGPDKADPSPTAIVLPALGRWANAVRITDTPEDIPLLGEPITVLR